MELAVGLLVAELAPCWDGGVGVCGHAGECYEFRGDGLSEEEEEGRRGWVVGKV